MSEFNSLLDQFEKAASAAVFEHNDYALNFLEQKRQTLLRCVYAVIARAELAEAREVVLTAEIERLTTQLQAAEQRGAGCSRALTAAMQEMIKLRETVHYVAKQLRRENHLWVEDEAEGLGEILADALPPMPEADSD